MQLKSHLKSLQQPSLLKKIEESPTCSIASSELSPLIVLPPLTMTQSIPLCQIPSDNKKHNNSRSNNVIKKNKKSSSCKSNKNFDSFTTNGLHNHQSNDNNNDNENKNCSNVSKMEKNDNYDLQLTNNFSFPDFDEKDSNKDNVDYYRKDIEIKHAIRTKELQSVSPILNKLKDNKYYHRLRVSSPISDTENRELSSPECSPSLSPTPTSQTQSQ